MNVTFVLPGISTRPVGGFKIVFEYANRLTEEFPELRVTLCFAQPLTGERIGKLPLPKFIKLAWKLARTKIYPRWFQLAKGIKKVYVPEVTDALIPDGDWIFATAAQTAPLVQALSPSKGKKGYLIQDYETWAMSAVELEETYRYGMTNITISKWLKGIVDSATGDSCICISNPTDTEIFYRDQSVERKSNTIAVLYHEGSHKGFPTAWESICEVKKFIPQLQVNMFGTYKPPVLPDWVTYTKNATNEQLHDIYNSSSVFLCASINEGYGLTCVEAMACGCPLVVTDFQGSKEYALDGTNSLVVPVGDVDAIAKALVRVLNDKALADKLGSAGVQTAQALDWDNAVEKFAKVLGLV